MTKIDRTNFEEKYNIASQIQGWFSKSDMLSLHNLFLKFDTPINVLEIGTWKGRSTVFSLLSLPENSTLIAIDIFPDANDHAMDKSVCGKITSEELYCQCMSNISEVSKNYRQDIDIEILRADSKELLSIWIDDNTYKKFDLIFIDGDHSYEGFAIDFLNSLKLLKSGGILCGHDYGYSGPEVTKFLLLLGDDLFHLIEKESFVWVLDSNKLDITKERIKRIEKIIKHKMKVK